LSTGKRIGSGDGEILYVIDDMNESDPEAMADDLAMRLFASMRPSLRWNKMRVDTIDQLRKSVPYETMCYLLGRLMAPVESRNESFGDFCKANGEKIHIYSRFCEWPLDESFEQAMTQLLDIDSKRNLQQVTADFTYQKILDSCKGWSCLLALLDPWHTNQLKVWARNQQEAKYLRANPLAKSAFLRSAMETKPPSKTQAKKIERKQKDAFLESLLAELLGDSPAPREQSVAPKPVAIRQSTIKPIKFGVKRP
jgi:hypothetical protein